jgi:hypothetical protein
MKNWTCYDVFPAVLQLKPEVTSLKGQAVKNVNVDPWLYNCLILYLYIYTGNLLEGAVVAVIIW